MKSKVRRAAAAYIRIEPDNLKDLDQMAFPKDFWNIPKVSEDQLAGDDIGTTALVTENERLRRLLNELHVAINAEPGGIISERLGLAMEAAERELEK